MSNETLGKIIKAERQKRNWTVKQFREQVEPRIRGTMSASYVTRIEQYGEIPSPELLCVFAEVFGYDIDKLLELAKKDKVRQFDKNLDKKYRNAVGQYRLQKESGKK